MFKMLAIFLPQNPRVKFEIVNFRTSKVVVLPGIIQKLTILKEEQVKNMKTVT